MLNYSAMANMGGKQVAKQNEGPCGRSWQMDYANIIEIAVTKIQNGLHLDLFPSVVSRWPCKNFFCLTSS